MLTTYRASAGSGKTYQLTLSYLQLLLAKPAAHRNILAVTFTNKATEEMKQRIVKELFLLANSVDESTYCAQLSSYFKIDKQDLSLRARESLVLLLHDFSMFQISTIDRFFQQTTRAFARELGLQGGYNIEMEDTMVLDESIDTMLFQLEKEEHKELLKWLLKFAEHRVEQGDNWDLSRDIKKLASQIFSENYKAHRTELLSVITDKEKLALYIKEMKEIKQSFEKKTIEIATEAMKCLQESGLQLIDFKGKSNCPLGQFRKWERGEMNLPTATFYKLAESSEQWIPTKAAPQTETRIIELYSGEMGKLVKELITHFATNYIHYATANEISRYFYTLGILGDIDAQVKAYEKAHNIMLLSDTTEFLHNIIAGSDTPFIYEKIGTRINHYMIDEFQDTSTMQWSNFYPLFADSLAYNRENLIVGDVKQSIYRWRSSDWRILSDKINTQFDPTKLHTQSLDTNWRSLENIVAFNNTFFTQAAAILDVTEPYKDVCQKVSPKEKECYKGKVSLSFIPKIGRNNDNWMQTAMEQLPPLLQRLQDEGVALHDIIFLVSMNKQASTLANYLMSYQESHHDDGYRYDVISDYALFLSNMPIVQLIVALLYYLQSPHLENCRLRALFLFEKFFYQKDAGETLTHYFTQRTANTTDEAAEQMEQLLKDISALPLYEICEKIVLYFPHLPMGSHAIAIQAFQDLVLDYTARHNTSIDAFLEWWEDKGVKKTIAAPPQQEAIRILTIHKSKGLESKIVIIPFCQWDMLSLNKEKILWCDTPCKPFDQIPIVPVRMGKSLENTHFANRYLEEVKLSYIDNLNLAYVAFTRAREELYLFAPTPPKSGDTLSVASLLNQCLTQPLRETTQTIDLKKADKKLIALGDYYNPSTAQFVLGDKRNTTPAHIKSDPMTANPSYLSVPPDGRVRFRLMGEGYFEDTTARNWGNLMHEILSHITHRTEIVEALSRSISEGLITSREASEIEIKLTKYLSNPTVEKWFSPTHKVWNEQDILSAEEGVFRPDRIVQLSDGSMEIIDYKFGKKRAKSHIKQVAHYITLLQGIGYKQVKGYLWYVEQEEIVEVNP